MTLPESAIEFITDKVQQLRSHERLARIVFPEGEDPRVIEAANRLSREGILQPVLVVRQPVPAEGTLEQIVPSQSPRLRLYARLLYERRRSKGLTEMEAVELAQQPLYFANLMLVAGDVDGCVASAVHTTAQSIRAILHTIELEPGTRRLSSSHLMAVQDRHYGHHGLFVFSDAAINIDPSATELAEIAIAAAKTTRSVLGAEPLVALLSFSTKGSAEHPRVKKVQEALRYVQARAPELKVDGELQVDAAVVPEVGRSKAPGSPVAGKANTLVFPDLDSANIGYKLVERLGRGALLAVVVQGIAKPSNIVSRGCTALDIYHTAIVTAVQAMSVQARASYQGSYVTF